MSELSLSIQKEVYRIIRSKAFTVNGRGDVQVDGVRLSNDIDGRRALTLFYEGVDYDVLKHGEIKARELYYKKSRNPGGIGSGLESAIRLSRMFDSEDITK